MFQRVERRLYGVARRKWLAVLLSGLVPLILRALLLPFLPIPVPRIQDEFSHLLVADTFAHGRLVNPVHPMWAHFESMHMVVRPVYASVFPIAHGIVMACAQVLTGVPWIGVWFGTGCMCAALCWMLQGWVSPGWALAGGMLAAIRFGVLSYWMNSYYGGAVAAAGGALVLGALGRIVKKRGRWQDGVWMGLGLAILANSRPYEGFILSLPLVAVLIWALRSNPRPLAIVLPLLAIIGVTAVFMGYYNRRFSGNPFQLPYSFYRANFTQAPHFIWQPPRPEPSYHHRVLRDFHNGWEMGSYEAAIANRSPNKVLDKLKSYWRFYLGPILSLPFLTVPWLLKRRRPRYLLLTGALVFAALIVEIWHAPHYAAPAAGLVLLLAIEALRQLRAILGRIPVWLIVLACLLTPVIGGSGLLAGGERRANILHQFESIGERHLILVRYARTHDSGDEWVYNSADIDHARVVWAREMDPTSNRELIDYFKGRRVWLVQPDATPVALAPYDPSLPPDPPFRFVKLGTDAVTVLRSPEEIQRNVLRAAAGFAQPFHFSCDQWSYFFRQVTGVEPPDPSGCYPADDRGRIVDFDQWFKWLLRQQ